MIRRPPRSTLFPYHDALPICTVWQLALSGNSWTHTVLYSFTSGADGRAIEHGMRDRKSTRLNSSHSQISYAVFCLKKKNFIHKHYVHACVRHLPVLNCDAH